MDFIFASAIAGIKVLWLIISYNIACQWFVNLFARMENWPKRLRFPSDTRIRAVIPKLHFRSHEDKGHAQHCLHWTLGAGLCDCEGPE